MNFLFPTFLFALASAAIPVVVHLFNFRKFRRVKFTNVKFLQEIRQETDSRSRIKHWLILAARVLALVFLVLAFAQPYIPSRTAQAVPGDNLVAVYIDNSYSMGGPGAAGTLLDEAREQARQLVLSYHLNDRFQLITNDFKGEHRRWTSRDEFLNLLDEVDLSSARRTLEEVLSRVKDSFDQEPSAGKQAYVFSDFQENVVPAPLQPDSAFQLNLTVLDGREFPNVAVDSLWFLAPAHRSGSLEKLVVQLGNYSDQPVEKVPLKLIVNGQQQGLSDVAIPARSKVTDTLIFRQEQPGWQKGKVSVTDYPVTFDDDFYFSFRVAPEVNVLLINGPDSGGYLDALYGDDEFIRLEVNGEDHIDYGLIAGNDLVVLNGLKKLSSGLSEQLTGFLKNGGTVCLFPALDADLESYNRFLSAAGSDTYAGPSGQGNEVVSLNLEQDVFSDVFEQMPENPDLPRAGKYFLLDRRTASRREGLLMMRGEQDLVARYASGKGALYLSAVPLDKAASDLPEHALFVPLMYRIALLSVPHYPLYYTLGSDQAVQAGDLPVSGEGSYRIRREDFEAIPDIRRLGSGTTLFLADQITRPGHYSLAGRDTSGLAVFAFNGSRLESDLSYLGEDGLENLVRGASVSVRAASDRSAPAGELSGGGSFGVQLWKYCLILALVFLAAEILLIKGWPVARKI